MWADGNISNSRNNYNIRIEANYNDMVEIENIIMKTGNWTKYTIKGRMGNNDILCYKIGFKKLYNIFREYGYDKKSEISPFKILELIPDNIRHYFFLGLIDGDGCFYINKKQYTYQFILVSTYEQDWTYMKNLCNNLNISKYRIDKKKNKPKKKKIRKN